MRRRRTATELIAGLLLAAVLGTVALAADPAEEARQAEAERLIARLQTWTEERKKDDIVRALPRLVKLHGELESKRVRDDLLDAAAEVVGEEDLGGARLDVVEALAKVKDPDGVWKHLERFMPDVKVEAAGPLPLRVVQTVGLLAPDGALRTLLRLMEKADDPNVSRHAIQALGRYGWSRRRVKVLDALLDHLRKLRPGGTNLKKGRPGGEEARELYAFLSGTLVAALDELTGRKLGDADKWLAARKEYRRKLHELFTYER